MFLPLPDFSAHRVLVVGDVMLDRYWHGSTSRISPEAPVPVVQVRTDEVRPGGAGNVALNAAALGCRATLVGLVGQDEAARLLTERLATLGVDCRLEALADAPTITKLRVISRHQQLIRLDFEDAFDPAHAPRVEAALATALGEADAVILSDYAKGTLADVQALIALARAAGKPVVVDPKGRDFARYRGATVIKPNLGEFEAIVGPCPDEATLAAKAEALRAELELEALLVTRSEHGVTLVQRHQPALHLPTRAREVFDVTGAGDTVSATLGCALAAGLALPAATALANLAAGVVVAKLGTASVSVDELREAMNTHAPLPLGPVPSAEILPVVARARAAGERLAVALGPFPALDTATLAYLEQARHLADRLLLVLTPEDTAAPLLPALRAVDWVVSTDHANQAAALILALAPEVLAHLEGQAPPARLTSLAPHCHALPRLS
ncbi:MAG: D-glycero-beta-D-manno-heptose-7-phosphate kinase [Rhodocyclaceae bacterium]|jgi:D-beta-D-heptose 7-phosphate kinase/D-beta-D-heptose 1-phosphate adenosyltransferase|nr:D-glycero-beta-D-manno-heptose-7-phosphate kinase [Rhodocyclaceae bacterium]